MKTGIALCLALVALLGLMCAPEAEPTITVIEGSLSVLVTEVDGGIEIENLSGVECTVCLRSPEGEQQFDLDVGESITVTDITAPIEVKAVAG